MLISKSKHHLCSPGLWEVFKQKIRFDLGRVGSQNPIVEAEPRKMSWGGGGA